MRDRRVLLPRGMIPALDTSGGAGEDDFRHRFGPRGQRRHVRRRGRACLTPAARERKSLEPFKFLARGRRHHGLGARPGRSRAATFNTTVGAKSKKFRAVGRGQRFDVEQFHDAIGNHDRAGLSRLECHRAAAPAGARRDAGRARCLSAIRPRSMREGRAARRLVEEARGAGRGAGRGRAAERRVHLRRDRSQRAGAVAGDRDRRRGLRAAAGFGDRASLGAARAGGFRPRRSSRFP